MRIVALSLPLSLLSTLVASALLPCLACSSSGGDTAAPPLASAGAAGSGGEGGSAGTGGGVAGSSGMAGNAGTAGASAGSSGASGTGPGGAAGGAGSGGAGGSVSGGSGGAGGSVSGGSGGSVSGSGGAAAGGSGGSGGMPGAGAGGVAAGGAGGSQAKAKFCDLPSPPASLTAPAGFCIHPFTGGTKIVNEPRVLRFAPNGDLFVMAPAALTVGGAEGGPAAIVVLPDDDHNGKADSVLVFAGGVGSMSSGDCAAHEADPADLHCGHGLTFADGYIYYTRSDEVRRFPYAPGDRKAPQPAGELVATLGGAVIPGLRFTHTVDVAPDGSVVVSRGRGDDSMCTAGEMTHGAVLTLPVQNGASLPVTPQILADGFRNPLYLRCFSGQCFASELSGDQWDGIGGHEKVAMLGAGQHWGYPCCVDKALPTNGATADMCANITGSDVTIPLHDTPFGMDLESGKWPAPFTRGVFVALHGKFATGAGSRLAYMPTDAKGYPSAPPTDFVTGWDTIMGRVADVAFAPDGRLFVIDDFGGSIWWIAPVDLEMP